MRHFSNELENWLKERESQQLLKIQSLFQGGFIYILQQRLYLIFKKLPFNSTILQPQFPLLQQIEIVKTILLIRQTKQYFFFVENMPHKLQINQEIVKFLVREHHTFVVKCFNFLMLSPCLLSNIYSLYSFDFIYKIIKEGMMQRDFLKIEKADRSNSLSKKQVSKKEVNISIEGKKERVQENSMPKIFRLTPPKKARKSEQIGNHLRDINQNIERRPSKIIMKTPMKLRLSCQTELSKIAQLQPNTLGIKFLPNLNNLISNVVRELLSQEVVVKNHGKHYIFKQEILNEVLQKIICTFLSDKTVKYSQSMIFLDETLNQIQKLVGKENHKGKVAKNAIRSCNVSTTINDSQSSFLQENQLKIMQLQENKSKLLNEISQLASKRQAINYENIRIKTEIKDLSQEIRQYRKNIEQLSFDSIQKQQKLNQISELLCQAEKGYMEIQDYVQKQAQNKHVKNASKDYKQIESAIYQYASYLQANQLATSLTYQSIPLQNQRFILDNLEKELKDINASILSKNSTLEEKARTMRDFVLKVMAEHKRKDVEYEKAIEFKTRSICKFVNMMKKWLDNWTLKQEYLVGLRKQFAVDSRIFSEYFEFLCEEKICTACRQANGKIITETRQTFLKIEENYKMGNSFY